MTTASTTVGPFTLTGQTKSDGTIGYSLNSPDGSSYLGTGPLSLVAKPGVPNDSSGKPMTGYKYYSLGQDQFLLLTENEGATLAASLPSMVNTVNKEISIKEVVAAPAPPPASVPAPVSEPIKVSTVSNTSSSTISTSFTTSTKVDSILGNTAAAPTVTSSSTITVDPTKLTNASLKDDQSVRADPTKLATLDPANPLKDDQAIRVDPTKLPATETANIANLTPQQPVNAPAALPPVMGLTAGIQTAAGAATAQDQAVFESFKDWRVRLSLAPGANYLYRLKPAGVLAPLAATDGVVFPYTPSISVSYSANYEGTSLTHTNYRIQQYQNSSVDQVQITCEFTAQDVREANYVLAVIHFFRTMTKMFYGKDENPKNGTPPPLCYIYGMGGYQFDALPLAITGFTYSLPQDVDYIKTTGGSAAGTPQPPVQNNATGSERLGPNLTPGGKAAGPNYGATTTSDSMPTSWVPTKIQLSITCVPIMSRNAVSNKFSLKDYATGTLLNGTRNGAKGGGFW